jgi:hypothetical protein
MAMWIGMAIHYQLVEASSNKIQNHWMKLPQVDGELAWQIES